MTADEHSAYVFLNLKQLRKEVLGLSKKDVARGARVSDSTIDKAQAGKKLKLETCVKIFNYLNREAGEVGRVLDRNDYIKPYDEAKR